jgi:5-methylcytosine-specific restriction endonuclease McrA
VAIVKHPELATLERVARYHEGQSTQTRKVTDNVTTYLRVTAINCDPCGSQFLSVSVFASAQRSCSEECSAIRKRDYCSSESYYAKAKRLGVGYESGINWRSVVRHKGGDLTCYLCGDATDPSDGRIVQQDGKQAHYVAGSMHPSLEHVKPMSKGGNHYWDNVDLAHLSCNSSKGDEWDEIAAMSEESDQLAFFHDS